MPSSPFSPLSFKALVYNNIWKHKKCSSRKASSGHATTMDNLPSEVLSDIFTRLLAKQVAQMRCVSKSWNDLLSDSSFIKSHLHRSLQKNDEVLLFSSVMFSFKIGPSPFGPHNLSCSPDVELTNFIKLPVIPQSNFECGSLVGSVNGLICFTYASTLDDLSLNIWNPSLSLPLRLPCAPGGFELGFGYDPNSDDYKIVKLTLNMEPQCEVYSMRKASWNMISLQSFPSCVKICWGYTQVYVDGHVYWLCDSNLVGNPQMILVFDLGAETFSEIPLPDSLQHHHENCMNYLGVLGGKLCATSRLRDGGKCEVWVMNEYGVPDSWVKHPLFSQFDGNIIPYGFTSHGEFLFQVVRDRDLAGLHVLHFGLYDPIAANTKTFKIKTDSWENKFVEYVDSLVWVAPPTSKSPPTRKSVKVKRKRKASLL